MKILQFQNRKLVERIEHRRRTEEELKQRIEQLEQRQATDDAVLCIVNKYWNQVNYPCNCKYIDKNRLDSYAISNCVASCLCRFAA